ncbi:MAG TPA: beta-ketoacyl synthase chain length factor [Ramlibacter sp.]
MTPLRFTLHSAGIMAPGLLSLDELRTVNRGEAAYAHSPLQVPPPAKLPAQERRRASAAVRLVLACCEHACGSRGIAQDELYTVFATDEGTGEICQQMLDVLATTRQVSPLVFSNSVVNAPSGYFSIASGNRLSSTVVSLGLDSFAGGLLCAVTEAVTRQQPVLLACYDVPMTPPMDEVLPVREGIASAWVISSAGHESLPSLACFELALQPARGIEPSALPAWMPAAWQEHAAARALAALAMLDSPAGASMRFALGGQHMSLRLHDGGAQ